MLRVFDIDELILFTCYWELNSYLQAGAVKYLLTMALRTLIFRMIKNGNLTVNSM